MKKITSLFCFICLHVLVTFAQWEWQNPLPQGNTISSLSFIDNNNGWAVGWGTIMSTNDGGLTWDVRQSDFRDSYSDLGLEDVCFTDNMNGWIVGGMPGLILHTKDGGQSWSDSKYESTKLPRAHTDVFFIDDQTGWVLGWAASIDGVYILRTTDGGESWGSNEVCELSSLFGGLYFLNNSNGWVVWGHKIMHTTDGGVTWEVQFNDYVTLLSDVYFIDADHGWAVGKEGAVLITSDGGVNWEYSAESALSGKHLLAVSFISPTVGWCCGYSAYAGNQHNGNILKTTDGGQTWENQTEENSIRPVLCLSNVMQLNAIAAGEKGLILKLNENRSQWIAVSSTFTECNFGDIFFIDQNSGWAAGGIAGEPSMTTSIFHTNDGGTSWTEQELDFPGPGHIGKIFFTDSLHGWVTGIHLTLFNIYLFNTVNGGETWGLQSSSYNALSDFYFVNNSVGWRVGEGGTVNKTSDGGWNWEDQNSGTDKNLNTIFFIDDVNGWSAGDSVIIHTSDGGQTWIEQSTEPYNWQDIFFADEQIGWVTLCWYMNSGMTMRTLDGGQTWDEISDCGFHEIIFFDSYNGWGRSSTSPSGGASSPPVTNIFKSIDGGETWEPQPIPTLISGGFCFSDINQGWAVSIDGAILHTNNEGPSGFEENVAYPEKKEVQIYPNPAREIVNLQFTICSLQPVSMKIYDLNGRVVAEILDMKLPAGEQQFSFDASALPDGMYLLQLAAGVETVSKKLIVLR